MLTTLLILDSILYLHIGLVNISQSELLVVDVVTSLWRSCEPTAEEARIVFEGADGSAERETVMSVCILLDGSKLSHDSVRRSQQTVDTWNFLFCIVRDIKNVHRAK